MTPGKDVEFKKEKKECAKQKKSTKKEKKKNSGYVV